MLSSDKILKEASPMSIFFVKLGSTGNRLLFRYPYDEQIHIDSSSSLGAFDAANSASAESDRRQIMSVIAENDEALCNMFSVNPILCGQKFEIKINNVRHVGHPMSVVSQSTTNPPNRPPVMSLKKVNANQRPLSPQSIQTRLNPSLSSFESLSAPNAKPSANNQGDLTSFNIVCALSASASYDIVDCYHDLSRRLAVALSFEERRCAYLSREIKTIIATLDERDLANLDREQIEQSERRTRKQAAKGASEQDSPNDVLASARATQESVFAHILKRSNLARDLKRVFVNLSTTGIVDLKINNWITVSFCLPQKVHRLKLLTHKSMPAIGTRDIKRCLLYLRPYHGLLLLQDSRDLLDSLPIDASPALIQLIKVARPEKNLMDLSVDANLTLMQTFCLVSQLIYWAKATVIYPICDSNIYAIHPLASTGLRSELVSDFQTRFPTSKSLHHYLADFSEGISLSQLNSPLLQFEDKLNLLNIVSWLLQRRILIQIHKYIFLVVDKDSELAVGKSSAQHRAQSESYNSNNQPSDLSQLQSPPISISVPDANDTATSWQMFRQNQTAGSHKAPSSTCTDSMTPQLNKLSDSFDGGSFNKQQEYRTDNSLPESQDDNQLALNSSSLSSTPNTDNMDGGYPSPSKEAASAAGSMLQRMSLSNSYQMDSVMMYNGVQQTIALLQRAGLSLAGAKSVLEIPSARNGDDLKLLLKLIPYFDGKHHVEDIMFYENLERSQVLIICDKFRSILFTCHYEDVAVSQLSPVVNKPR